VTRRTWLISAAAVALALVLAAAVTLRYYVSPLIQADVVRGLSEKMGGEVTIERLDVGLLPRPSVSGRGIVVRHRGRTDVPPLVQVREFSGSTSWPAALARRAEVVQVEGLEITIPPRTPGERRGPTGSPPPFTIDRLVSNGARVTILTRNPEKDPRVFEIHRLDLRGFSFDAPSAFEAELTNPIPVGLINTSGSFGPWNDQEPAATPVGGRFTFDADLGTIKGIAGQLHAEGDYSGPLDRIEVTGTTATPDFRIPKLKAHALTLENGFDAVVDGTNGDVILERVESTLGRSRFTSKGAIVGTKGVPGKRILLEVVTNGAHLQDVLRLTTPGDRPAMTGQMALETSFDLPPGEADVLEKLELSGQVSLETVRFTSETVQNKVDELSKRGQGRPGDEAIDDVVSNVAATFELKSGVARLNGLRYQVRGAKVEMNGVFALESRTLDFQGVALLDASVSATQTGIRRFLLMPLNPLFRKGGAGTRLAIKIGGTLGEPKFGVDIGRTLKGK
jgi:hypothetical protein